MVSITLPAEKPPPVKRSRPRRAGRPCQLDAAGLPERILASARDLFLDRGFAATSVQQIAERAGVTKRTLYVKVGDKEALFSAVVADMLRDWRRSASATDSDGPLRARLEQIGLKLLTVVLAPEMVRLQRVLAAEAYRFPALLQIMMQQSEDGPIPQLTRLLTQERGGSGAPSPQDMIAARLLHEMILGAPLRTAMFGRAKTLAITREEWVREAVGMFLNGWRNAAGQANGGPE